MVFFNENYLKLKSGYLFPEIAKRVSNFSIENPEKSSHILRAGIGDVTEPIPEVVCIAMQQAISEMATRQGFRGYGPEQGYPFLRKLILEHDYKFRGIMLEEDEIFISDGSKCDISNILDIFSLNNRIAIMNPTYPVYVDTNVMIGRTGSADSNGMYDGICYLESIPENNFIPSIPQEKVDIIYLCFPNNPTGAMITRSELGYWVDYALKNESVILYDAAYEAYINDPELPHSIYEIPEAKRCAIEFRSFSKNAGFTGIRCAFTIVPKDLKGYFHQQKVCLHQLWQRRFSTKFNGVNYITQFGAAALYTDQGRTQINNLITHYRQNTEILCRNFLISGLDVYGGKHAPYIWIKAPNNLTSWEVFDKILNEIQVVVTPGSGFGSAGNGFFRVSAFNSRQNIQEIGDRFQKIKW